MNGLPVSSWLSMIRLKMSIALTVLREIRSSATTSSYFRRKLPSPFVSSKKSCRYQPLIRWTSCGSNRYQSPRRSTASMNRSGMQIEVNTSCARRRWSPLLSRRSRKASMSRCQTSRYTATAPLRWPSWSTETAVLLSCLIQGTTPPDELGTPRIAEPEART